MASSDDLDLARKLDQKIAKRLDRLDLTDRLRAAGRPWPEADADGRVVMRGTECGSSERQSQRP